MDRGKSPMRFDVHACRRAGRHMCVIESHCAMIKAGHLPSGWCIDGGLGNEGLARQMLGLGFGHPVAGTIQG